MVGGSFLVVRRIRVDLQAWERLLAEHDALSAYIVHTGSAVFAVPPGARPGGFLGEELVEAARPAPSGSA